MNPTPVTSPKPRSILLHPHITLAIVKTIIAICVAQLISFVALDPILAKIIGQVRADEITGWAQKIAEALAAVVAVLGWLAGAGRSFKTAIDNPTDPTNPAP